MKKWLTPLVVMCYMTVVPIRAGGQTVALPEQINTTFEEFQPLVTLNGNRIYFSRKGDPRNMGDHNNADCWYSEKNAQGEWMEPIHCGMVINNFEDNALVAIDFRKSWGVVKDGEVSGQFTELEFDKTYIKRTKPIHWADSLPNFHILEVHFLPEKGIGVLSLRDEKGGDADLYITVRSPYDSIWSIPEKMEGGINGQQDERYPHLAPDGKTLYFASTSHGGFGGSDVFISRLEDQNPIHWSAPRNMGRSINSALDETATSLSVADQTVYFTRTLPLKGSDLFSVNLESSFLPEALSLVVIKTDSPGQLVKSNFAGKTERLPEKDSIFYLVLNGGVSYMLTFLENQNNFYPSRMVRASLNEAVLDYESQPYMDILLADPEYKLAELEIQKLQKEILNTRTSLKNYGQQLDAQMVNLVIPHTTVFENEGFRTDRTLLELEQKYERFLKKSLAVKEGSYEVVVSEDLKVEGRDKRIADLKRQINKEVLLDEDQEVANQIPLSFMNFREIVKREVELELFPEVWGSLVSDMKSTVQLEVKKKYESESYRNILKGDWLKDSIPQFWSIPVGEPIPGVYNNALAGDLKRHLKPIVKATMFGLLKGEVTAYLEKIFHLVVLNKIQRASGKKLSDWINAQKNLEEKIFDSLVESKERNEDHQAIQSSLEELKFRKYEWSLVSEPLVKHVYFELPAINFSANEVQLDYFARLELNRIVQLLQMKPHVTIEILVHTHGYMSYSTADSLTNQRAEHIENYLSRAGVKPGRVKVIGMGKNNPKLANHNYENRRQNQRVEILIK